MLETYFIKPQTVDRIRASWIGPEIEHYADWLAEQGYSARTILRRVPMLVSFGEFARLRDAQEVTDLPGYVDDFVTGWITNSSASHYGAPTRPGLHKEIRGPIEHLLNLVLPGFERTGRHHRDDPFVNAVPGFFEYLVKERGLRPTTVRFYGHHLNRFQDYLIRIGITDLQELSPAILSAFIAERSGEGLSKSSIREGCGILCVFLRYAHREGYLKSDLARTIGWPQVYRLSTIPRSISWGEVAKVLGEVDRRTPCGKRDYSILLLLATYGLRGREIVALTLDDIDWKRERLAIPERKAGHSTAYPLSITVGEALVDYLRNGRPESSDRHVFFRAAAPLQPISNSAVSGCARKYIIKAGIEVPRPGSHTLRHTCVQRLIDCDFSLKTIGDFIGHRSAASTEIYAKVAVESLRQVALGDGEEVLG